MHEPLGVFKNESLLNSALAATVTAYNAGLFLTENGTQQQDEEKHLLLSEIAAWKDYGSITILDLQKRALKKGIAEEWVLEVVRP